MYPAFAVCSNVDSLSCLNTPYPGFCTMLELAITPSILRGKRQAPPDATLMIPVELTPQVDSIPATGHSETVCADEIDTKLGAARTIAKAIAFDTRMKGPLSLFPTVNGSHFPGAALIWIKRAWVQNGVAALPTVIRSTPMSWRHTAGDDCCRNRDWVAPQP